MGNKRKTYNSCFHFRFHYYKWNLKNVILWSQIELMQLFILRSFPSYNVT
jgi:hypothetical protein